MIPKKQETQKEEMRSEQFKRRLLDLTKRNALLFFTEKHALRLNGGDCDAITSRLKEGARLVSALSEGGKDALRVQAGERELKEKAGALCRRGKEAEEETGAGVLYAAFGILQISRKEGLQRAPLVLAPIRLRRAKGKEEFIAALAEGERFLNATLLEYLRREYDFTFRALGDPSRLKISELLARIRAEVEGREGWEVKDSAYLAPFSFQRYLVWNELRRHLKQFEENALVHALLHKTRVEQNFSAPPCEDESDPAEIFLPLPADSSQYAAAALAHAGVSFVLHGPPGTGKSQTIANVISDALGAGKKVLFVAEKRAALEVVKKRLDGIGIGEFCLELHTDKADRAGVFRRMEETLALEGKSAPDHRETARRLAAVRDELKEAFSALHEQHAVGMSVFEAVNCYLKHNYAPDLFALDSTFCEGLDGEKLEKIRALLFSAAAAAKECGGAAQASLSDLKKDVFSAELKDAVSCAAGALLAEIKHLKSAAEAVAEFFHERLGVMSFSALETLAEIVSDLIRGAYKSYFCGADEENFIGFFHANRRLDERLSYYEKHFTRIVCCGKEGKLLRAAIKEGGDRRTDARLKLPVKKLKKVALHPLAEEDMDKYLKTLAEILEERERVLSCPLSKSFLGRDGRINYKKRAEWLEPLYKLHTACNTVFADFNADAFNGAGVRAAGGCAEPIFHGYLRAYGGFCSALQEYLAVTGAERETEGDALEKYSVKAASLLDNLDLLPKRCSYRAAAKELESFGLTVATEALERGRFSAEKVLAGFERSLAKSFLEYRLSVDPVLSRMNTGSLEETAQHLRLLQNDLEKAEREYLCALLVSRLNERDGEEENAQRAAFSQLARTGFRGKKLRELFTDLKELTGKVFPCLLMSPTTAAQYLPPTPNAFDLVIFDEASQLSTAEALGCLARGKSAIIAGDTNQLPPPAFFRAAPDGDDELTESLLDDCLLTGLPERRLKWHYRSRHESLIAFSNAAYYANSLCTFPSPDAEKSRVRMIKAGGVYDRGRTKCNRGETEALVAEIVRRLQDPVLKRKSMGVVTFSNAQQEDLSRVLYSELAKRGLERAAFEREEPLFVKNLENVQGDERDVILFSVCYGPDEKGKLSLNFGPLNRAGGWRRLNVAVSRAREEMLVFSSLTPSMIDLARAPSRGVEGLKAFLEFAEHGTPPISVQKKIEESGVGARLAEALSRCGYECRLNIGASDFKVDVAVLDPADNERFLLAVLLDRDAGFSVKDREILEVDALKNCGWRVVRSSSVSFYQNPAREIKRIKELLDRITGADRTAGAWLKKYARPYRAAKSVGITPVSHILDGEHDEAVSARIRAIVAVEEPISRAFLKKRLCDTLGIARCGARASVRIDELIDGSGVSRERAAGVDYFYKNPRAVTVRKFRAGGSAKVRRGAEGYSAFEILALVKGVLEERVAVYADELAPLVETAFPEAKINSRFLSFLNDCIAYGEEKGLLTRSSSDRISLV